MDIFRDRRNSTFGFQVHLNTFHYLNKTNKQPIQSWFWVPVERPNEEYLVERSKISLSVLGIKLI